MELEGKSVLILAEQLYNEYEFIYPYYRLQEAGARVTVVGAKKGDSYKGKYGMPLTAAAGAADVKAADHDAVVIPGGYAPDHMRRHKSMVALVRDMHAAGGVVAAICHAGWMLASAGILEGKVVTSFFAIRDDLTHAGAEWVDREVVSDGKLITSRTPDDLPAFLRAIIDAVRQGTG